MGKAASFSMRISTARRRSIAQRCESMQEGLSA
jgi:hypothetical protein